MKRLGRFLKKYFIPHEANQHKPHILRIEKVAFACLIVLAAELVFVFGVRYTAPRSQLFGVVLVNALVDETNQSRTANALPPLHVSSVLQAAAQAKANDMTANDYFAHTSPAGLTPWYWFQQAGYNFAYAGENLAVNFTNSEDVTNAWMNSPEHRANILDGNFTEIGMATAEGTRNGQPAIYVVELFGTPAAAPIAFVNQAKAASSPVIVPAPVTAVKPAHHVQKPAPSPQPAIPTVVAIASSTSPSGDTTFVAVKGAQAVGTPVTTETPPAPAAQGNWFQSLLANPGEMANDFYLLVMALFGVAMILNFFIKIRIQHPQLIFGGALMMVIAGTFIILNQHIALFHSTVL